LAHGPTPFPSKGCCIYCQVTDATLTREHIVPLSIGGQHTIERASCLKCADITKRFEQDVARELWGHARISANAPSRRRKARPSHVTVGHPRLVTVPYSEYPPTFVFYKMPVPGILQGVSPELDFAETWQLITVSDDKKLKEFEKTHNTAPTMSFRHVPLSFGRMIAKIGYGHVLTQLDLEDFEPLALKYILGTDPNVSYVVGCKEGMEDPLPGLGYQLRTLVGGSADHAFISAEVRLLANCHTPTYTVVVGQTRSTANTIAVIDKLGPGQLTVRPQH
jgi:HNH endonuclease